MWRMQLKGGSNLEWTILLELIRRNRILSKVLIIDRGSHGLISFPYDKAVHFLLLLSCSGVPYSASLLHKISLYA